MNLASGLDGVKPSDISVTVSAASVRVQTAIAVRNSTIANRTLLTLVAFTPSTLSSLLSMTVEAVEAPEMKAGSSEGNPGTGTVVDGEDQAALNANGAKATDAGTVMAIIVGILAAIVALAALFYCRKKSTGRGSGTRGGVRGRTFDGPMFGGVVMSTVSDVPDRFPAMEPGAGAISSTSMSHLEAVKSRPEDNPFFSSTFEANFDDLMMQSPGRKDDNDADMRL